MDGKREDELKELISTMNVYGIVEGIGDGIRTLTYVDFIALLITEIDIYVGLAEVSDSLKDRVDKNKEIEDFLDNLNIYISQRHKFRKELAKDKIERRIHK